MISSYPPERTFEERDDTDERIAYGLIGGTNSFDYFYIQFRYYKNLVHSFLVTSSYSEKIKVLCYGPGYNPEKSQFRLGDPNDLPPVNPADVDKVYDPPMKVFNQIYAPIQILLSSQIMNHFLDQQSRN